MSNDVSRGHELYRISIRFPGTRQWSELIPILWLCRKQQVTSGQTELQALEARLKEMEERLQTSKSGAPSGSPHAQRRALANPFGSTAQSTEKALPQRPLQASSRPGTAKQAQHAPMHGGAMPPTPTASEGESDLVNISSHDRDAETASVADYVIVPKDGEDRDS